MERMDRHSADSAARSNENRGKMKQNIFPFITADFQSKLKTIKMCANAQRDGRPAEYRWRPLFNAANFG